MAFDTVCVVSEATRAKPDLVSRNGRTQSTGSADPLGTRRRPSTLVRAPSRGLGRCGGQGPGQSRGRPGHRTAADRHLAARRRRRPRGGRPPTRHDQRRELRHRRVRRRQPARRVCRFLGAARQRDVAQSHRRRQRTRQGPQPRMGTQARPASIRTRDRRQHHHLDLRPTGLAQRPLQRQQARRAPDDLLHQLLRSHGRRPQRPRRDRPFPSSVGPDQRARQCRLRRGHRATTKPAERVHPSCRGPSSRLASGPPPACRDGRRTHHDHHRRTPRQRRHPARHRSTSPRRPGLRTSLETSLPRRDERSVGRRRSRGWLRPAPGGYIVTRGTTTP